MVSILVLLTSLGVWAFPAPSLAQETDCIVADPDPATLPDPAEFAPPPAQGFAAGGPAPGVCTDDGRIIDVLVLYTPLARTTVEQFPANYPPIQDLAALSIAKLNESFLLSQIPTYARLVGIAEIPYDESSALGVGAVLSCLSSSECMPLAHYLREQTKADIVTLITGHLEGFQGVAYIGGDFNVVQYNLVATNGFWTVTHEIGHCLGAGHQNGTGGGGTYSWCHAFVYDGPAVNDEFRTVMTSSPFQKILNFSSPDVLYAGVPTGVVNTADNARCIEGRLHVSAMKRLSDCNYNGVCDPLDISNNTSADCDRNGIPDECGDYSAPFRGCCKEGICSEVRELCCMYDGGTFTTIANCGADTNNNGIDDNCDGPIGACCSATGCDVMVRKWCIASGRTFKGDGTRCGGGDCNNNGTKDGCETGVLGACCISGVVCSEMLETCCTSAGGAFGGKSSVCEDCDGDGLSAVCEVAPNQEFGACCDEANGKCTIRTACSCHAGTFMGAGSTCTSNWCNIPY